MDNKFSFHYLVFHNRNFDKHDAYIKLFALLIPIIPTWLVLNYTRWTANTVTIIGLFFGITGAILGYYLGLEYLMIGFLVFLLMDFVDGNVAIARGGGTFIGTILDMTSDRIIFFLSIITLSIYHLSNYEEKEVIILLVYLTSFLLVDILQLAFLKAKDQSKEVEQPKMERQANDFRKIIRDPFIWIPSRLSSYLFIISIVLISGSFITAYCVGIVCVIGEYIKIILKYSGSIKFEA